jgi:hypothetical protein
MLGRTRGATSSSKARAEGAGVANGRGQEATVSQFVAQLGTCVPLVSN